MQVLNNAPAFSVWKSYANNVQSMRGSMSKLSSGMKIQSAGDDPAGLAMSERLRAQARNSAAAANNIENEISYIQTADSWLQKVHDILGRMTELAIAANDGTKDSTDLGNLQQEFSQMQKEVTRITDGTTTAAKYNGKAMFQGEERTIQVGPDYGQEFTLSSIYLQSDASAAIGQYDAGTIAASMNLTVTWGELINASSGLSIAVQSAAGTAVAKLNVGIDYISQKRAVLGSQQSRLNHTLEGLRNYEDNIRGAESQIRDVDVAKETTEFSKYKILTEIGTAMLAQANQLPQGVLQLIG
jgi:flagellin